MDRDERERREMDRDERERLERETDTALHRELLGDDSAPLPGEGVRAADPARSPRDRSDHRTARVPSRAALRRSLASVLRGWMKGLIPYKLAALVSGVAVLLAMLPILLSWPGFGGVPERYDAGLAILTLTVLAVIWYTAVTYDSVELSRRLSETAEMRQLAALSSRAGILAEQVEALPAVSEGDAFDLVALWHPLDEQELVNLAIDQSPEIIAQARDAERAVRWVRRRVEEIKDAADGGNLQTAHRKARELQSTWWRGRGEALEKLNSLADEGRIREEKVRRNVVARREG